MSTAVINDKRTDFIDNRFKKPINIQKDVGNYYK